MNIRLFQHSGENSMSNTITELPVERNDIGYWSHPAFEALIGDREGISSSEFDAWLQANNLEDAYSYWGKKIQRIFGICRVRVICQMAAYATSRTWLVYLLYP
jgi:hypothetical protein